MRKRCMKTMLSVLLAVAMLVTAAPADLTLTVQAAEAGVEDPQSAESAAVGAENVGGGKFGGNGSGRRYYDDVGN